MTTTSVKEAGENTAFVIEGHAQLENRDGCRDELPLRAFAFGPRGQPLGEGDAAEDGSFRFGVAIGKPQDLEVVVGPAIDASLVRQADAPVQRFTVKDWARAENGFRLVTKFALPRIIWWPWRPIRVCVRGRVRKDQGADQAHGPLCPVPFAKVEVFDVDREGCLWPILYPRLPGLFDRPVIKLPELVKLPKVPDPIDPIGPVTAMAGLDRVALNPQPLPPRSLAAFDPQPEPPLLSAGLQSSSSLRLGELKQLPDSIAARLDTLTITSRIPPWLVWPRCFFSKALVCQTETDCDGRFRCCFWWWPFHVRNGRLRFDSRPDIVIKVTQVIGGVSRTIYLDPYTSTRWDSWGAYIDLVLDDEDIACGSGCSPQPEGTSTHFVRVGNDEVYEIDQANGVYDLTRPGLAGSIDNMAYGGSLNLHAVFGDSLSDGAPQHYYRLSIMGPTTGGGWKDIKAKLTDTRVHKVTNLAESHDLGPFTIGATNNLYEIRNTATYHWYNADWIGTWHTSWAGDLDTHVPDEGLYTLRLEVFDSAGTKLTSASVDYRDGTAIPPAVLPAMVDACYLVMQIDNKPATVALAFPAVVNPCGVVPIASAPFDINALVNQENGRLNSWSFSYVKGLNIGSGTLASASSDSGLAVPVNQAVSSAPMTAGLTGTCAFSLTISAWAHIRNGYGLVYHSSQSYALAVDACRS